MQAISKQSIFQSQRHFFDNLAKKLRIQTPADWYRVTLGDIKHNNGGWILNQSNKFSHIFALQQSYPELGFKIHKFQQLPSGFWIDVSNHRAFFDEIAKELNISHFEDWYNITASVIQRHGGGSLLQDYYSSSLVLKPISET